MGIDTLTSIFVGVGLATACGLRVFIPLLVVSMASHFHYLQLTPGFHWLASTPAVIAFSVAASIEVGAYYIPWVDHALDVIATPSAMIAGTIVSVALMSKMDPFYKWALGVIAGGGMAGLVQGSTVVARGASTALTGGLANPLFSSVESAGAIFVSVLAVLVPVMLLMSIAVAAFFVIRWCLNRKPRLAMSTT